MAEQQPFTMPDRIAIDAAGYGWRVWDDQDYWSMVPTNPDNSPIPEPITWFVQAEPEFPTEVCHGCNRAVLTENTRWDVNELPFCNDCFEPAPLGIPTAEQEIAKIISGVTAVEDSAEWVRQAASALKRITAIQDRWRCADGPNCPTHGDAAYWAEQRAREQVEAMQEQDATTEC